MTHPDRNLRQRGLIDPDRLAAARITVIGVGAIGRQVALQLAALGVGRMTLIDPQTVDPVNLGPQAYFELDVNQLKVAVTAETCRRLNAAVQIDIQPRRFTRSTDVGEVVFACVDSIDTRRLIYESANFRGRLLIDGRMAAEVVRVLAVPLDQDSTWYRHTLFPASEAYPEPCTARSTVYAANLAAALMVHQFTRWLRGLPTEPDQIMNLLAGEMMCATGATSPVVGLKSRGDAVRA